MCPRVARSSYKMLVVVPYQYHVHVYASPVESLFHFEFRNRKTSRDGVLKNEASALLEAKPKTEDMSRTVF